MRRVAILGGGVTGATLAAELAKSSRIKIDLYESSARLGGLHQSVVIGGKAFDIGYFIFGDDNELF